MNLLIRARLTPGAAPGTQAGSAPSPPPTAVTASESGEPTIRLAGHRTAGGRGPPGRRAPPAGTETVAAQARPGSDGRPAGPAATQSPWHRESRSAGRPAG